MAGILDRYGIKEVADVTFYKLDDAGVPTYPVLYLDTLKVSTIEQTADEATANGGKGNPPLVIWDYNKDITVTLEDALFSAKSLAIMFGDGTLKNVAKDSAEDKTFIMKTEVFTCKKTGPATSTDNNGWESKYQDPNGKLHDKCNPKFYNELGENIVVDLIAGTKYFCTYDLAIERGYVVEVSANSFPGTYYVTGDTYARSDISGDDEFFQFIIPKAKVQSENTITLEADGDPSTFNMSLHVMRPENGKMMMLVKYNPETGEATTESKTSDIYHNHYLDEVNDANIYGVGTNRNDGIENGTLRIKQTPIRSLYAFAGADIDDELVLEQYNALNNSWTEITSGWTIYDAKTSGNTIEADESLTEDTPVWYEYDGKRVGPVTIKKVTVESSGSGGEG